MSYIFTYSRDALSVFIGGVPRTVNNGHPKWEEIMKMVTGEVPSTPDELEELLNHKGEIVARVVAAAGDKFGRVTIGYDAILLDGKVINSTLTNRMLEMINQGFDIAPMARFMDKLYANPSRTAVEELFLWLDNSNLPITEEGNFLAYKKVDDDYSSFHKNPDGSKCWNKIGTIVEMPRNEVDDRRERTCSNGLHFCSYTYLPSYYGSQGRVVVLEINPAEVVSIPSDYNNAKGRAHRYLVRDEITQEDAAFAFPNAVVPQSKHDHAWEAEEQREYDPMYDLYFGEDGKLDDEDFDMNDWEQGPLSERRKGKKLKGYTQALTSLIHEDDEGEPLELVAYYSRKKKLKAIKRP